MRAYEDFSIRFERDPQNLFFPEESFMGKVAIITDSTSYIPKDYLARYKISMAPLVLIWGHEALEDGIDIQPDEFYRRLATAKTMPTTSQVAIPTFEKAYTDLLEQGYDVLGIFISSKLSGTIQSAIQAREMLTRGKEKVEIVDSLSTSMAMGFQILTVSRAAADGASLNECRLLAEKARQYTGLYFVVDTLEFLHRGGRIGGAQRFLGTALNLKPLLALQDGKVEPIERIRTKGKAQERLVELVAEQCTGKAPIRLAALHANAYADAQAVMDSACEKLNVTEKVVTELSPVVGTHAGPGTIGLAYMAGM
jgi:DegV family protein with EDD domain